MKNLNKFLVLAAIAVFMSSCKDEKKEMADKKVDQFKSYVDSISNVAAEETSENWESIEAKYEQTKMEAEEALNNLENKAEKEADMDKIATKYEEYKAEVVQKRNAMFRENLRSTLFTEKISEDMSFAWVNKDNIADVYSHFVDTVDKNKDTYNREEWDEIKLLYEALDTRKNTVEKEGLSSKDNIKISGLKIKFATMYRINRATAKSDENAEAKE
ncbi:DUF6565 domain-containing protein [Flavobacterium sp. ST-87]|uniref:DUF6565 domain-containing protein n=1 Tax=Flavobacterium plantiphilum TaxID=3163297 RepID=A0ABW8XYH7_9FLAO